jgi:hypothetical protein
VSDIIHSYNGEISIEVSDLGGALVRIRLP